MKRWLVLPIATALFLLAAAPAFADERDGGGGDNQDRNTEGNSDFGPFPSASPDSGTCGPDWANDTFNRNFSVSANADGSFAVREDFTRGRFATTGPASPGACQSGSDHGSLVQQGIKGRFHGFLSGTVTSGTFDENGCRSGGCDSTAGFVLHVFGGSASYSCISGVGTCSFFFTYRANDQGLNFHHWVNASTDLGGNRGDIATS
jgi:hypothetical protein